MTLTRPANSAKSNRIQCSTGSWECDCKAVIDARTSIAPQRLIDEALGCGPTCATFVRGFGPDLTLSMASPLDDGGVRYTRDGREIHDLDLWTLHVAVFYDGSCMQRGALGFCGATWAVIQMTADNKAAVTISGAVRSCFQQTAQAAEHCGRAAAVQLLTGPARLL